MKNLIHFTLFLITVCTVSCSSNDDDAVNNPPQYRIEFTGRADTDVCTPPGQPSLNNPFSVIAEYLADANIVSTKSWAGLNETEINDIKELDGNIIGIRIRLANYNPNSDESNGTGVSYINIKISKITSGIIILIDEDHPFFLIDCDAGFYEGTLYYNTVTGETTTTVLSN